MMMNSGSLYNNSDIDIADHDHPLTVTSCGHYTLVKKEIFSTFRPKGRRDYQLLYIIKGTAYFETDGNMHPVREGNIVIYYPNEPQRYYYKLCDSPEIYWLHFTGNNVMEILLDKGLAPEKIFYVQVKNDYGIMFRNIIQELQLKRKSFEELANTYGSELFILMSRSIFEKENKLYLRNKQVEQAVKLLESRFNQPFSVSAYATKSNMSVCWFTRMFHKQVGVSPQQYLTNVRINKAKELLSSSSYNIGEIGDIVGYQNALYFSRVFKKQTGLSPTEYRKLNRGKA